MLVYINALTFIPMVTGTLSIVASSIAITKVLQSETKLSNPYNRLLIGMCAFDIMGSSCHASSTLPIPKDTGWFWAFGNDTTCQIQGYILLLSIVSTPFYNLALCIYFLCVIKYSMTDQRFRELLEPYLHGFPILYGLVTATYTLCIGYINPSKSMYTCWVSPPFKVKVKSQLGLIINALPWIAIFICIVATMGAIFWTVYQQEKTMQRYRFELNAGVDPSLRNTPRSQAIEERSQNKINAVRSRATWFFGAYLISYTPISLYKIHVSFLILSRTLYPLQGVFNLCAHLQPQVGKIQGENPDYWYLRALYTALMRLDTDVDTRSSGVSRRRSSRRLR